MLRFRAYVRRESGITLIETLIALAILGAIAVIFLGGLLTTSKVAYMTDKRTTAVSLAQLQTEWVKAGDYVYEATQYPLAPTPDNKDYLGYSVTVIAEPLHIPDDGIQRITVNVNHAGEHVFRLESYKVNR